MPGAWVAIPVSFGLSHHYLCGTYFILQGAQLFYFANPYDSVLRNLIAVGLISIVEFLNFDKQQSTLHHPVKLEMADGLELNGTTKSTETSMAEAQPYLWL